MKSGKNKILAAFAIFLMLSLVASVAAYTPKNQRNATVYISTNPQTIKLGDFILVNAWTSPQPPLVVGGGMAGRIRTGYVYTIVKPDGTSYTRGPVNSTGEGGSWFTFVPDQLGTWQIKMSWPGDEYYFPCESPFITFKVQSEAVPSYPAAALPTGYWTSPVNVENREWASTYGPWLQGGYNASYGTFDAGDGFNPFTTAPESAHILWKRQVSLTGVIGGFTGNVATGAGGAAPPVIMFGNLYYNVGDGFVCVDLRTGVEKWKVINASVTAGQITGAGATPYIWEFGASVVGNLAGTGITIKRYNAFNGVCNLVIQNGMSGVWDAGSVYITPPAYNGPSVGYGSNQEDTWFARWDASRVSGGNWATGIVWNVTRPKNTMSEFVIWGGVAVFGKQSERQVGYNITNGALLWDVPRENAYAAKGAGNGLSINFNADTMKYHAINIYTGEDVWDTPAADYPWGSFAPYCPVVAYDKLYTLAYDGHIYAYKTSDGSLAWKYYAGDTTETPYGTWAFWWGPIVADGKVYAGQGEHSPTQPLTRGNRLCCVNAETGTLEWSIAGMFKPMAIAEGYFVAVNVYDGFLYCFGKGQTTTTVEAANAQIGKDSEALITGTVRDNSPAQPGTPALSKDSIIGQMEFLHMQKPAPSSKAGVPVTLQAIGSSGNSVNIGTATTDANGVFSTTWTPTETGVYRIVATFGGTESYWSSTGATTISVGSGTSAGTLGGAGISAEMVYIIAAIVIILLVVLVLIAIMKK